MIVWPFIKTRTTFIMGIFSFCSDLRKYECNIVKFQEIYQSEAWQGIFKNLNVKLW